MRKRNTEIDSIERDISRLGQCIQNHRIQTNENDMDILLKRKALKMKYNTFMKEKCFKYKLMDMPYKVI